MTLAQAYEMVREHRGIPRGERVEVVTRAEFNQLERLKALDTQEEHNAQAADLAAEFSTLSEGEAVCVVVAASIHVAACAWLDANLTRTPDQFAARCREQFEKLKKDTLENTRPDGGS